MQEFYNKFFMWDKEKTFPLLGAATHEESLALDIKKALLNENYELAAQIRDYCKLNDIDIKKYL